MNVEEFLHQLNKDVDNILDKEEWQLNMPMKDFYRLIEIKAEFIRAKKKIHKAIYNIKP